MIAVSFMLLTSKLHWAALYNTNSFDQARKTANEYMAREYKDVPYTLHLYREDGQYQHEQVALEKTLCYN